MLPNPLSPTDSAPAAAAHRPHLKIAVRSQDAPGDDTVPQAVIPEQVQQWQSQWRSTVLAIKETLTELERTCDSAIEAREAGVAGLIETLVGGARAEAEAAAQQVRAQARIETTRLQAENERLQSASDALRTDLQAERERMKHATERLEAEIAARLRAERERDDVRRTGQEAVSAAERQVERLRAEADAQRADLLLLRQQLEAGNVERARLMAKFQLVQRVLTHGTVGDIALEPADAPCEPAAHVHTHPDDHRAEKPFEAARDGAASGCPPAVDAATVLADAHPDAVEDIRQVLEQVKAMYELDVNSGRTSAELVDSLTNSLRYARDVIVSRANLDERDAQMLFEREIDMLLDLKGGTAFGRHLSISAYASRGPLTAAQGESPTATQRDA